MSTPRGFRDRSDDSLLTLVGEVPELVRNLVVAEIDSAKKAGDTLGGVVEVLDHVHHPRDAPRGEGVEQCRGVSGHVPPCAPASSGRDRSSSGASSPS